MDGLVLLVAPHRLEKVSYSLFSHPLPQVHQTTTTTTTTTKTTTNKKTKPRQIPSLPSSSILLLYARFLHTPSSPFDIFSYQASSQLAFQPLSHSYIHHPSTRQLHCSKTSTDTDSFSVFLFVLYRFHQCRTERNQLLGSFWVKLQAKGFDRQRCRRTARTSGGVGRREGERRG